MFKKGKDKDKKDPYEHLKDKSQEAKQGDTEAPGSNLLGEGFEQKTNKAPDYAVDKDEK